MFYDIYSLETALINGEFEYSQPQLDSYKLIEAIKFLTTKVRDMESQQLAMQTDFINSQTELFKLQEQLDEHKELIRKMGKDYPELVFSNPKFYIKEETNVNN